MGIVTEEELAARATGPRITQEDVESNIRHEAYFTAWEGAMRAARESENFEAMVDAIPESLKLLTICVITTNNGFTVLGQSACASPENFNADIGQRIARENAVNQLYGLMGYELKSLIHLLSSQQASGRSPDQSEATGEGEGHDAVGTGEGEAFLVEHLNETAAETGHPFGKAE